MKTSAHILIVSSALAFGFASPVSAAPGDLDPLDANIAGGSVLTTAVQPDGKMILAGRFNSVLGTSRNMIARLNPDGTLDGGFDPNPNGDVNCVAVQSDGKVLLAGTFTALQPNGGASITQRGRIARVNADGTVDTGFNPNADGAVWGVVVQSDGKVLLAGSFTALQPNGAASSTQRRYIARVHPDGTLDTGFDPNADAAVVTLAVQDDGKVLLGGSFTSLQPNGAASATPRNYIARVHADGTLDTGFDPHPNNGVSAMAVQPEGRILLGGVFVALQPNGAASPTTRTYLARLNADGTLDPGFDPAPSDPVAAIAVQSDGKVLVGGSFTALQPNGAASATERWRAARLHADGTLDQGFDPKVYGEVYSVSMQANGMIMLGGLFSALQPNGAATPTSRNGFALLTNDPATQSLSASSAARVLWSRGGAGPELSTVTFELSTNGGTAWTLLGSGTRMVASANWERTGLALPASGHFRARGRTTAGYLNGSSGLIEQTAAFSVSAAGNLDPLNVNINNIVLTTAVQPDGKMIIAGEFISVQGVSRSRIARLNPDGTLDAGFDPRATGAVYSVAVQSDGKVLLAGGFTALQPNGAAFTQRRYIARVNADGTLDAGFDPSVNNYVLSVAVQPDGKVLLGGYFTTLQPNGAASATPRYCIARVHPDGTLDTAFNPNPDSYVNCLAVQDDGKVLLGGWFTSLQPNGAASPTPRNYIARIHPDGTLDTGFDPRANYHVSTVAEQADGKILLGGVFSALQPNGAASPTTRANLARLNADGTLDPGFDPNPNGRVRSIAVQSDGKVLLGGVFTVLQPNGAASATTRQYVARLHGDGTLDPGFDPMANNEVYSVSMQPDGKILLGGAFGALQPNGAPAPTARSYFARLINDPATQTLSVSSPARVLWSRGGAGPELSTVTFELSTDGGTAWTPLGSGTRVETSANWQLTGLALPYSGELRARGQTMGGFYNGSSGLIEQAAAFLITDPEIAVEQPAGLNLTDGSANVRFTAVTAGSSPAKTFTIKNSGTMDLTLGTITKDGANAGDFAINTTGTAPSLATGESTTFAVTFTPAAGAASPRNAAIHIANNDSDENPFDINLSGTVLSFTTDTDGDGLNDAAEHQLAALGFDWQRAQPSLVNMLNAGANGAGLYSLSQVQALNADARLLRRDAATGQFTVKLGLQKATDLTTFTPFPFVAPQTAVNAEGHIEFNFTAPDNAAFFRLSTP